MNRRVVRNPVTPGEILAEEFLKPLGLTQKDFADHIGVDTKTVKFAAAFSMSAEFWLNLQHAVDIWKVHQRSKHLPKALIKAS